MMSAHGNPIQEASRMTDDDKRKRLEDESDEVGAEGGTGGSFDTPPGVPSEDDDSALGDSDQHSAANA